MSRELDCTHLNPVRFLACRAVGRSQDPPGAEEGAATPHPVGAREDQAGLERRVKIIFHRGQSGALSLVQIPPDTVLWLVEITYQGQFFPFTVSS